MTEELMLKACALDGGERSVQDIVSKLKFLSKIKKGEKLDVNSLLLYPDNFQTTVYRTLMTKGESRTATLKFMITLFNDAFDLASKYLRKDDVFLKEIGNMIVSSLQESKSGIEGFIGTYSDDRMFVAQLETLNKTLDAKLVDLNRNIKNGIPRIQHINEYPPIPSQSK